MPQTVSAPGLTTGHAPFVEEAGTPGELYIRKAYELYSQENHEAWRRLYERIRSRWERYANVISSEASRSSSFRPTGFRGSRKSTARWNRSRASRQRPSADMCLDFCFSIACGDGSSRPPLRFAPRTEWIICPSRTFFTTWRGMSPCLPRRYSPIPWCDSAIAPGRPRR